METDIMRMTMDDFENLPYWTPYSQEEAPAFDSVIIYPTDIRSIHDSGWGNMTFVACNKGHAVCRYERDITLRALARRCGVSVGHLSKLENGYCDPTVPVAYAICRALHLSIYIVFPDHMGGEEK